MRLKTAILASAVMRRANGSGAFAAVRRRGAEEAGALFVKVARLDGTAALYGPAPPSFDNEDDERRFEVVFPPGTLEVDVEARMVREISFDPDLWFIEIEDRDGRSFLDA